MKFNELYDKIRSGELSKDEARKHISLSFVETANQSILDINRDIRNGVPEIIYGEHKSFAQVIDIVEHVLSREPIVIVSRFPDNQNIYEYFSSTYPIHWKDNILCIGTLPEQKGYVLVISGGSADHPVAMETELTLKAMGVIPLLYEDRGIAHPTRVLEAVRDGLEKQVRAVIVIAGMEASLATFVSSIVPVPVIGVPTSVGYGLHAKESALYAMLASCTPNLAVVNIDGGIRAAVVASLMVTMGDDTRNGD